MIGSATSRSPRARELGWAEDIDRGGKRGERGDRREEGRTRVEGAMSQRTGVVDEEG